MWIQNIREAFKQTNELAHYQKLNTIQPQYIGFGYSGVNRRGGHQQNPDNRDYIL